MAAWTGLSAPVVLYALGLLWFVRGARRTAPSATVQPPSVSIVVAARDEESCIEACLRDLAAQDLPDGSVEILLVDDGSSDATVDIARATADALSGSSAVSIHILDGPAEYGDSGSKKAALSLGVARATNDIILTTDADCRVPPGWARSMAACLDEETGLVIGFSQIGHPGAPLSALGAWEGVDFLLLMTAAAGSCALQHPMAASGQSLGFRRRAFDDVGGYTDVEHRASGDDVLLLQLIRNAGNWRVRFCADAEARVVHPPSTGLLSFLNRRARWASNAPMQLRLDPLFFAYMVLTFSAAMAVLLTTGLALLGTVPAVLPVALWIGKATSEAALAVTGARRFGRLDLLGYFPFWAILQPVFAVVVGAIGPFGFFRWKGRAVTWGRQRAPLASTAPDRML